jgi:transposase
MAVVQLRNPTEGRRVYFDAKKAAGKTSMEAIRALKRRLSNVVYSGMLADHKRREATRPGRAIGDDPAIRRDRPDPRRRLFGQATYRTRQAPA